MIASIGIVFGCLCNCQIDSAERNDTRAGENLQTNPVISALPALLKLDYRVGPSATWIRNTFSYAADEIAAGRMGSETVFAKLSELLFVEAIRRYAESLPEGQTGWVTGLRDPFVSRALAVLHPPPGGVGTIKQTRCTAPPWV